MQQIENVIEGEIVKDVVGYEGLYAVTSLGRVWRYGTGSFKGKWLKVDRTGDSYVRVPLSRDGSRTWYYIHRIVAKALIPNPCYKKYVNHIDGDKFNSKSDNLEWVTMYENQQHSCDLGLNSRFKLSAAAKFDICESYMSGKATVRELAVKYNVVQSNIYRYIKNYERMKEQLAIR
jgi:hypothetical protein